MRLLASVRKSRFFWVSLLLAAATAVFWYPSVDKRMRFFFAERALRERNADDALDWLKKIPDERTGGQKEFLMARAYRRLGQSDRVRDFLQLAFDEGFPVERLEREQWLMLAQSGQMREAEPHLRQLLQDPGDDGQEICESYVTGYFRNRQIWKALPIIDAWQADFPDDPRPHTLRGTRLQEAEKWQEAIAEYRKALQLAPDDTRIRLQIAVCLKATLQHDLAETEFRRCLTETPHDERLQAEWGDMLLSVGRTAEATAVFEQLLAASPGNPDARFALGGILLMNGNADDAVAMLQTLYEERPYDTKVEYSLASALQAAGKTEQAAEMFQRVVTAEAELRRKQQLMEELDRETDPVNQVKTRFEIATISMNHESPTEGLRWLMSVIDMDPGYKPACVALADYYRKIGNTQLEQEYRMLAERPGDDSGDP